MTMTAVPSSDQIRQAGEALKTFARSFLAGGGSAIALSAAMSAVGTGALSGLVGPEKAADVHRMMANKIEAVRGEAEDVAVAVQRALDGLEHDIDDVFRAGLLHCSASLAARHGVGPTVADLKSVAVQLEQGAAERVLRSGNSARDYN